MSTEDLTSSNSNILGKRKSEDEMEQVKEHKQVKEEEPENNNKTKLHFLFVSGNKGKQDEVKAILDKLGLQVSFHKPQKDIPEIQHELHQKVVEAKMKSVLKYLAKKNLLDEYKKAGVTHILIEDTGLGFEWMDYNCPQYVKSYLKNSKDNERMCDLWSCFDSIMNGLRGVCIFMVTSINNFSKEKFSYKEGTIKGELCRWPVGENGFGWDPIFFHKGLKKSLAQMTPDEKESLGFRRKPLEYLLTCCLNQTNQ